MWIPGARYIPYHPDTAVRNDLLDIFYEKCDCFESAYNKKGPLYASACMRELQVCAKLRDYCDVEVCDGGADIADLRFLFCDYLETIVRVYGIAMDAVFSDRMYNMTPSSELLRPMRNVQDCIEGLAGDGFRTLLSVRGVDICSTLTLRRLRDDRGNDLSSEPLVASFGIDPDIMNPRRRKELNIHLAAYKYERSNDIESAAAAFLAVLQACEEYMGWQLLHGAEVDYGFVCPPPRWLPVPRGAPTDPVVAKTFRFSSSDVPRVTMWTWKRELGVAAEHHLAGSKAIYTNFPHWMYVNMMERVSVPMAIHEEDEYRRYQASEEQVIKLSKLT